MVTVHARTVCDSEWSDVCACQSIFFCVVGNLKLKTKKTLAHNTTNRCGHRRTKLRHHACHEQSEVRICQSIAVNSSAAASDVNTVFLYCVHLVLFEYFSKMILLVRWKICFAHISVERRHC